jgi:aminoglycoside phosphotransferase (APT) family kinase protein
LRPEIETEALERIAQRLDPTARLVRAWPLPGGVSARVTALEVRLAGGETPTFVVRMQGKADEEADSEVAAREFGVLQLLSRSGLPVPAPRLLDESGEILPTPYLVIDFVESDAEPPGRQDVARRLASALAAIHAVGAAEARLSSRLPDQGARAAAVLGEPPVAPNDRVLLHGDFWPGNVLWRDGHVAAVVDWEDAALGDPLADVGNCRLELLWAHGAEATAEFTEHYRRAARDVDLRGLPYWDLYADLRLTSRLGEWGLDPALERELRARAVGFRESALHELGRREAQ